MRMCEKEGKMKGVRGETEREITRCVKEREGREKWMCVTDRGGKGVRERERDRERGKGVRKGNGVMESV
jgi:hypothetical protein